MKKSVLCILFLLCIVIGFGIASASTKQASLLEAQYEDFEELPRYSYYLPDASALVGCWSRYPMNSGWIGETLNFYEDGTYIYIYEGGIDPRICLNGTWIYKDDALVITIFLQVVNEGGEIVNEGEDGIIYIKGGVKRVQEIDPPMALYYLAYDLMIHYDDTLNLVNPILTMNLIYDQYWKIDDNPGGLYTLDNGAHAGTELQGYTEEWDGW